MCTWGDNWFCWYRHIFVIGVHGDIVGDVCSDGYNVMGVHVDRVGSGFFMDIIFGFVHMYML